MSDLGFDPSLKKKKKTKKIAEESDSSTQIATGDAELNDMFAGLKKKKKASKPAAAPSDEPEESTASEDLSSSLGDLTLKKKKKKSVKNSEAEDFEQQLEKAGVEDGAPVESLEQESSANVEYGGLPYEALLNRFFTILKKNNPELAGDRSGPKFRIPPPVCQREGSKKTLFVNVQEIAKVLQRNPEHLIQFLFAELGTSGSIDGEKRLVLKGKFQPKQMESVLRRYIIEYVTCKTCKSMNTVLKRESANRLHFLSCNACGSTRSVSSIKTGFQAQVGRRKRV